MLFNTGERFKWFLCLSVLFLSSCQGAGEAPSRAPVGKTEAAAELLSVLSSRADQAGAVMRIAAAGGGSESVSRGESLRAGDRLATPSEGTAMLKLLSGPTMALNSDSKIKVLSPSSVQLERGELWLEAGYGEPGKGVRVETPLGDVDLKGAVGALRMTEDTLTTSLVTGSATIVRESKQIAVAEGQEAVVDGAGMRLALLQDPAGLVSWTRAMRQMIEDQGEAPEVKRSDAPSGLGTLVAHVPGSSTPLPFRTLAQEVTVRIQDRVAITTVEQIFENPTGQVVEGEYKFPLPGGAKLNRYDMEIKGVMMRGEIVERERGRKIMKSVIDEFKDRMRDPALVEWEAGSTFKTRIFPIQGKEKKRIVLSYFQTLEGAGGQFHYVLPVAASGADAPKIPDFRIDARVSTSGGVPVVNTPLYSTDARVEGTQARLEFKAQDFEPKVDFVIQVQEPGRPEALLATYGKDRSTEAGPSAAAPGRRGQTILGSKASSVSGQDYLMLSLAPELPTVDAQETGMGADWLVLVDSSQSRTLFDMEIQRRLTGSLISALRRPDRVKVMSFDMAVRLMDNAWGSPSQELLDETNRFLSAVDPAGGTNLAGALRVAAKHLERDRPVKVVVMGDGAATIGENRPGPLVELAGRLFKGRHLSVTTIGVGSSVDSLLFKELSRRTGGKYYYLSSGEDLYASAVRLVADLRKSVLKDPRLTFDGLDVEHVYPAALPSLGAGDELSVVGRFQGSGAIAATLSGNLAGEPWSKEYTFNIASIQSNNSFIPLLWASRRIDALTLEGDESAVKKTVKLSKKFSIPSRYTSFIVLENQAMYREFRVARRGDRFEWKGDEGIDYEAAALDLDEAAGDYDDMFGQAGSGQGALGLGTGAAHKSSAGPSGRARASAPSKKKTKSKPMSRPARNPYQGRVDFGDVASEPARSRPLPRPRPRPRPCPRGYEYDVRIWGIPGQERDRDRQYERELRAQIEKDPLGRKQRRNLVRHLLHLGQYTAADEALAAWREMDASNPSVLEYSGDIMKIAGQMEQAMRSYSGIIDLRPEDAKTMSTIASFFESREQWIEAYPFRVSLSLAKPKSHKLLAKRVVAAARAGLYTEAEIFSRDLVEQTRTGDFKLKKGVRLSKTLKSAVLSIVRDQKLPLLYEQPSAAEASAASFRFELQWDGDRDLDLWVSKGRTKFIGGQGSAARLIAGDNGRAGELMYMSSAPEGLYKIQVLCRSTEGCDGVTGQLKVKAPGKTRRLSFTLQDGLGADVAAVKVERWRKRCY